MSEKEVVVNLVNEPDIEGIKLLVKKVKNLFNNMNINKAVKNLDTNKILKILSEITKLCYEVKIIANEIKNIEPSQKASKILKITLKTLDDEEIKEILSPELHEQIATVSQSNEIFDLILDLLDWTSDTILDGYDNDDNGAVTMKEIEENTVKCCAGKACCPCWKNFARCFGKCWSCLFIKFCCCACSKNQVIYDKEKYNSKH